MTSRSYALTLITGAAILFLGLAATNLILDPWWVFRVSPLRHSTLDLNDRYDLYRAYMAAPKRYDAALLASSRGLEFSLDELSRHSDNATYARFSVSVGRLTDHLGVLEFLLRDKAARGGHLKHVFLLIDIESFGEPPPYAEDLQLLQPPAISGEPAFRFWWKNLTAVQLPAWRRALGDAAQGRAAAAAAVGVSPRRRNPIWSIFTIAAHATPVEQSTPGVGATLAQADGALERVSERPKFADDMRNWARIVELCRSNHIQLTAAVSPMFPGTIEGLDPADVANVVDQISRLAPIWDFSGPHEPSNRPDLWWSPRHFHPTVARMMVDRIFHNELPDGWREFGRLR
jgi:hypothetical protein